MIGLRRRFDEDRDGGFALIFVLLVTTAIMAAVATTLTVTTPNIVNAKNDQDASAAVIAAQAGIDDVVAYLSSMSACRSTTKICPQALGASSTTLGRTQLGTNQTFTWTTDSSLTPDEYVRVHSTGHAGTTSRTLTADLSLAPSILSFGYYTDYESQSPTYLEDQYANRVIDLTTSSTYKQINAYNTSRSQVSVTSPTTVQWAGPPPDTSASTNPYPAGICGQHWYYDSASSPGRSQDGTNAVWGETGSIVTGSKTNNLIRTAGCDVVFTTGMEMDGPIYTRDALYISDGTSGGAGPKFDAPVYTLWGFGKYNTPVPPATPWRRDANYGGNISSSSPYRPQIAGLDLELPNTIGLDGMPDNDCVYYGPTRVFLNGNGTASVTSPGTTTKNSSSDPACYPTSVAGGIVNFTLNYKTAGSGTLYVQRRGSMPTSGWPENPTKYGNDPSTSNEVFYLPAVGGATAPDQPNLAAAPSSQCSGSVKYSSSAGAPCAWTDVSNVSDTGGWSSYSNSSKCNATLAATDQRLFECEYSGLTSATNPTKTYATLRSTVQSALAGGQCASGTLQSCLSSYFTTLLQPANSGGRAVNASGATTGDHQYLVSVATPGTAVAGTAQSVGSVPTTAVSGDSFFTSDGTAALEKATKTPDTVTVSRQTYACYSKTSPYKVDTANTSCTKSSPTGQFGWGDGANGAQSVPQFVTTVTRSTWAITSAASGESYFPNTSDATAYSTGSNTSAGAPAGAAGTNQPGDLYVEGSNSGKLSMIAQDDVVITDDLTDPADSSYDDVYNPNTNAVDIVAGGNVRNYHPVRCVDQDSTDIGVTSAGWCPNDITGLYNSVLESNGTLNAAHPAMQYTNMVAAGPRVIDAALFALSGSFLTDNYNRGVALGNLTVNGGIYQSHRGANGIQWEYTGSGARPTSGYSLQYHYIDLEHANLPYAPPATGGSTSRVWNVVSISAGGS